MKIRYKEPLSEESREIVCPVPLRETGKRNVQLAYMLCCIAENLRGSEKEDAYDELFRSMMISDELYCGCPEQHGDKLELFLQLMEDEPHLPF